LSFQNLSIILIFQSFFGFLNSANIDIGRRYV